MKAWLAGMTMVESLGEIAGLLLIFLFILCITYLATRWIAKYSAGQTRSGNIKVIETYKLAPNRYLQIVQVAGKYLVLAVSKDQISLVAEVSEEELLLPQERNTGGVSFSDMLKKISEGKHGKDKN